MKFTLSWLKEHLETTASLNHITDHLTGLGLEVESVMNLGDFLKGFKIAHILEAKPHPQADRLQVCMVDYGQDIPIQVVCGASNARRGIKVVLGLPGSYVPALDLTLKVTKIRGVESFGMLCSGKELGLSQDHEGILELPLDAPIGQDFVQYEGLDDPVIDINVTPNRPDCLGVRGIARDLSAAGVGQLKPHLIPSIIGQFKNDLDVKLDSKARQSCPHYIGRIIRGIHNKPSPKWLQKRLKAVGLKPISALVDITNYISFDLCRPLHAFDFKSIKGSVDIRFARSAETFSALDEKKYALNSDMLVIADQEKILALGGVMGGLESRCTLETDSILLESAYFNSLTVAMAGRQLNLHSDSRARFERGIDPLSTRVGIEKATQLILEICGGEASDVVELGEPPVAAPHIPFHLDHVAKLTGVVLSENEALRILENLGFSFPKKNVVISPSWRPDITLPVDVVEEVVRIHGYDSLPEINLPVVPQKTLTHMQLLEPQIRHLLASRSYIEAITWSMVSQKQFQLFGGSDEDLALTNPITIDLEYLRPSVLVHLLKAVQQNLDRGLSPLSFFEIGPRYKSMEYNNPHTFVDGITNICGVRMGRQKSYHWSKQERPMDVFDVKADVLAILESCNIREESVQIISEDIPTWYHPGRSGWIQFRESGVKGQSKLGIFGELHPSLLKEFGIKERVFAFEIDLFWLVLGKKKVNMPLMLCPFQKVERDFCFLFNKAVTADKIIRTLKKVDTCVREVQIFDLYEGTGVPEEMKSVSIHMTFEPKDHTFTDVEIKTLYDHVVQTVQEKLQGTLRL